MFVVEKKAKPEKDNEINISGHIQTRLLDNTKKKDGDDLEACK